MRNQLIALCMIVAFVLAPLTLPGCASAGQKAPVLVGQSGVAVAQIIGQLSEAGAALQKAGTLPATAALHFQETLLSVNTKLRPVPDALRAIDAAQKAGTSTTGQVDAVLAVLQAVAPELATLLAGVPIDATTKAVIDLVRTAQGTVQTVLVEVARLRGVQ